MLHLDALQLDRGQERVSDATEWVHEITLRDGKMAVWRGHTDTAMLAAAYHGK